MLMKHQVRWAGHLVRMDDSRIPKQLFYGKLSEGKRYQGGQKKRYKDSLKASLKSLQINTSTWENAALDRPKWRSEITRAPRLLRREGWLRLRRRGASVRISLPFILQTRLLMCVISAIDFFEPELASSATLGLIETKLK